MLTISDLSKAFGGRVLFENVSLQINPGDRIGIVGPNGAGKSTLFSLIIGECSADAGDIRLQKSLEVGFLHQESAPAGDETVLETALSVSREMKDLRRKIAELESSESSDHADSHHIYARFDELGGYQLEPKAKRILTGLAFKQSDFNRPVKNLSGGWVMRTHLARLLVQEPDLLMLDEPTNHLDLEALLWFQNYLKNYEGAILMISHDREFLNQLIGQVLELKHRRIMRYVGNYDSYLVQHESRMKQMEAVYKNQQREVERLERFIKRFGAKATKATQAKSKQKQIDRMETLDAPESEGRSIHFKFPQPRRSGQKVLSLKKIHHAFGENVVYRDMDFQVDREQRWVLVGPNGAGKSTLLKILAGVLEFQSGERNLGHQVDTGYFSQYRGDVLHPNFTVLEEAMDSDRPTTEQSVRTVLGSFLFQGDDVFKRVKVLSGGEKSRLALVKLLLNPPNVLLMDEPTTHLDMDSVDALIGALEQFQGTLVFISHDVYFIRKIAHRVLHVQDGNLTVYPGDYQYYLDKTGFKPDGTSMQEEVRSAPREKTFSGGSKLQRKEQKRLCEKNKIRFNSRFYT
ncbi:MAG TPA: ABC-F family ATP-binding cassette domain-containing protein [Verrucomicrobiales bacterium]|nr:ABC-F family ATP-binding cassette domain-containing protein [Verrucomicrobiales bacterium]